VAEAVDSADEKSVDEQMVEVEFADCLTETVLCAVS
jgi:hypothetical protein